MSTELTLELIKTGREGWIYLIHAVGTDRYKIGRSTNPVSRHQTLQGQSPYPLKIVRCFWTIDAVTDELNLHESAKQYRAFGEWFELPETGINSPFHHVEWDFSFNHTGNRLAHSAMYYFLSQIGVTKEQGDDELPEFGVLILDLYDLPTDRSSLILVDKFVRYQLTEFAKPFFEENKDLKLLRAFLVGAISGFAAAMGRILQ